MASYREHLTFSALCGIGYGAAAGVLGPFTPPQAAIAGCLTGLSGMLPDLDSETGKPVRELSGVVAAVAPLVAIRHLVDVIGSVDGMILAAGLIYVTVRYGGAWLLGKLCVHRGMFHSIPALGIASCLGFLGYKSDDIGVRILMGGGIALGYLSHLVLDEIYAVQWNGVRVRLNKAAGSATKCFGRSFAANAFCYGLLFFLGYASMVKAGVLTGVQSVEAEMAPTRMATELDDAYRL
ncbi:MAG: metal-dependent hydrolase [Planctomycetaceae bacterium]|nr:metal-dependent hydrolase [Planctomycetaceae bacterium]